MNRLKEEWRVGPRSTEKPVNGPPRKTLPEEVADGSSAAIPTRGGVSCCGPVGRNVQLGREEW